MLTGAETISDTNWYPDSGATNHVTNDLANLNPSAEYHGANKVHMGNGAGLQISHIGCSNVSSLHPESSHTKTFVLKNRLHVSPIKNNLVYHNLQKTIQCFLSFTLLFVL